jgi:flagellar biosynthetic protein FliO
LLITLLLLVLFAWAAKRYLGSRQLSQNRSSRLQILERRPLTPKSALLLIKVDDEELVIAESASTITLIKAVKGPS